MIAFAVLLFLLMVVLGIGYAVYVTARRASPGAGGQAPAAPAPGRGDLADELARWTAEGLLSEDQAAAILARERRVAELPPPPPAGLAPGPASAAAATAAPRRRVPLVAEAIGYLGGTMGIVGLVLIVSRYWPDMSTAGRLALSGAGGLVTFVAGLLVRESPDPSMSRLRAFLWLVSTAAGGLFAGVAATGGLGLERAPVVAACAGTVALCSAALWRWRERPVQQFTTLAGVAVFGGAVLFEPAGAGLAGTAVWLVGMGYVLAALRRRAPSPLLTEVLGGVATIVGVTMTASDLPAAGWPFAVLSAAFLLGVAAVPLPGAGRADRVLLGVIGAIAFMQSVPPAIAYFAEGSGLATGLVTWVLGGALVAVGVRRLVAVPLAVEALGGVAILVGAAVTAAQLPGFAPAFGIVTAIGLIAFGMLPGRVVLSLLGTLGLLVNIPWAIGRYFPGEGRAPVLVLVSGVMLVAVAVVLARLGGRFRSELGRRGKGTVRAAG